METLGNCAACGVDRYTAVYWAQQVASLVFPTLPVSFGAMARKVCNDTCFLCAGHACCLRVFPVPVGVNKKVFLAAPCGWEKAYTNKKQLKKMAIIHVALCDKCDPAGSENCDYEGPRHPPMYDVLRKMISIARDGKKANGLVVWGNHSSVQGFDFPPIPSDLK